MIYIPTQLHIVYSTSLVPKCKPSKRTYQKVLACWNVKAIKNAKHDSL